MDTIWANMINMGDNNSDFSHSILEMIIFYECFGFIFRIK